jgi:hypothetical protein
MCLFKIRRSRINCLILSSSRINWMEMLWRRKRRRMNLAEVVAAVAAVAVKWCKVLRII